MINTGEDNVQIVEEGETSSSLRVHVGDHRGLPLCGVNPRPWHGRTMIVIARPDEPVTCRRCLDGHARIH